jgi:hypothetical protein
MIPIIKKGAVSKVVISFLYVDKIREKNYLNN